MGRAAIYIRWSTEDQGQGTTLPVQLESCRRYCAQQGWQVPDDRVYIDDGHSGGSLHRPAMTRLRAAVQAGGVDVVVVYRLDRLSRDLVDATTLVAREWQGRAVVRSATEEVMPEADEGWLNYSFRATFADYERRIIRQRTYNGRVRRIKEGRKVHGGAPYGWKLTAVSGVLAIDEPAAEVVRALFRRCADERMGGPALARWANERGIPSPRGARWRSATVLRLLRNPVYAGRLVFGRVQKLKKSRAEPGPWRTLREPVVEVDADPACLPPIVPRDLWERAQAALKSRCTSGLRGKGATCPRLLSGLVYCRCGGTLLPFTTRGRRHPVPEKVRYYRCWQGEHVAPCPYRCGYIRGEKLEALVERAFLSRVQPRAFLDKLAAAAATRAGDALALLQTQLKQAQQELGQWDRQLAKLDREYLSDVISIREARRLRALVAAERRTTLARVTELERALTVESRCRRQMCTLREQMRPADGWGRLNVREKKVVLERFVARIVAHQCRDTRALSLDIHWRCAAVPGDSPRP